MNNTLKRFLFLIIICCTVAPSGYAQDTIRFNIRDKREFILMDYPLEIQKKIKLNHAKNATTYFKAAVNSCNKGNFDEAISQLTSAIAEDDEFAESFNLRGFLYLKKGNIEQAISDLTKATEIDSTFSIAFSNLGQAYFANENFNMALKNYSRCIHSFTGDYVAYNNRGVLYSYLKQNTAALSDFSVAANISGSSYPFYNKGLQLASYQDYDEAINDFTKALTIDPSFINAYVSRASAYFDRKQNEFGLRDLNTALKLEPDNIPALYSKAYLYYVSEEIDTAIHYTDKILKLNTNIEIVFLFRGYLYLAKQNYPEAIAEFKKAQVFNPKEITIILCLGDCYLASEEFKKAIEYYSEVLKISSTNTYALFKRGVALYNEGEDEKSMEDLVRCIELDRKCLPAYKYLAFICSEADEPDNGIKLIDAALSIDSTDHQLFAMRAELHFLKGDYDECIRDYSRASKVNPDNKDYLVDIGYKYTLIREYDKALEAYTLAINGDANAGEAYYKRGYLYVLLGEKTKACSDFEQALKKNIIGAKYAIDENCK